MTTPAPPLTEAELIELERLDALAPVPLATSRRVYAMARHCITLESELAQLRREKAEREELERSASAAPWEAGEAVRITAYRRELRRMNAALRVKNLELAEQRRAATDYARQHEGSKRLIVKQMRELDALCALEQHIRSQLTDDPRLIPLLELLAAVEEARKG